MRTSKGRFIYRAALFRVSYYQDLFKERLKMEKIRQLSRIFPDIVKSCHNFYCDSPSFSTEGSVRNSAGILRTAAAGCPSHFREASDSRISFRMAS